MMRFLWCDSLVIAQKNQSNTKEHKNDEDVPVILLLKTEQFAADWLDFQQKNWPLFGI